MARKRGPLEPDTSQRLLENKLKLLQSGGRRRSLALDILTGRAPVAETPTSAADGGAPSIQDASSPAGIRRGRISGTGTLTRRTVYLTDEDLDDIEFVIRAWRRRVRKRVSRSEVLRQAIGNLRDAVELGAVPRARVARREETHIDG